ncbi:hypothetical protein [Burkholderia diffusa]|uniref:hypothetical protein n=1 Tax=Burkholderia diffusa TaxID=488732 RepID=UPI002ABE783E|nr:hypothetical protein [Burkholderia diffusa]
MSGCISNIDLDYRPLRSSDAELHSRAEGERRIHVIKQRRLLAYVQVSAIGAFVWRRLDGRLSIRELALEVTRAGGTCEPSALVALVRAWASRGFIADVNPPERRMPATRGRWRMILRRCHWALTWKQAWPGADACIARAYDLGGFIVFHPGMLLAMALLAGAGLVNFADQLTSRRFAWQLHIGLTQWCLFFIASVLRSMVHELAHGLAVKHFGREVLGTGWAWNWISPALYVNTSDMWLSARWPRIAVSLAGPCSDILIASLAVLSCRLVPPAMSPYVFVFGAHTLLGVVFNMCPLLKGDGYCILVDALGRRNLRADSIRWLWFGWFRKWRDLRALRAHTVETMYGLGVLLYLVAIAYFAVVHCRNLTTAMLSGNLSPAAVSLLGWLTVLALSLPLVMGFAGEIIESKRNQGNFHVNSPL